MNCLFCSIVNEQIPTELVYADENIIAFNDLNPQAPHHILVIPRQHIATTNDITDDQQALVGQMVQVAGKIAQQLGFAERGYRTVFNCNTDGGQTVPHIHLHILAGKALGWPPYTEGTLKL